MDSFKTLDSKWKIYKNISKRRLGKDLIKYPYAELHYGSNAIEIIEKNAKSRARNGSNG